MIIDILTLFPKMFKGPFSESIIKRATKNGLILIRIHDLRNWATDKHKTVDDKPYGGGAGMVIRVDIVDRAISTLKSKIKSKKSKLKTILLTPQGKIFNQKTARQLSKIDHFILICGHYEGMDARVSELIDEEISIGEYVLTGGELPAMVITDTVARLIPGVLGKAESAAEDSFSMGKLIKNCKLPKREARRQQIKNWFEYPQYTRPANYKGMKVPKILLSGNHQKIAQWRLQKALEKSKTRC